MFISLKYQDTSRPHIYLPLVAFADSACYDVSGLSKQKQHNKAPIRVSLEKIDAKPSACEGFAFFVGSERSKDEKNSVVDRLASPIRCL